MNLCSGCKQDFASISAFDAHRVGDYGPGEFKGNLADWTRELGRRCRDIEELEGRGFVRNAHGRWTREKHRLRAAKRFRGTP